MVFDLNKGIAVSLVVHSMAFAYVFVQFSNLKPYKLQSAGKMSLQANLNRVQTGKPQKTLRKQDKALKNTSKAQAPKKSLTKETSYQVNLADAASVQSQPKELQAALRALRDEVDKRHFYPSSARRLRQSGVVLMNFDILKNGELKNVQVRGRSSFSKLDESAFSLMSSIHKISERLPDHLDKISVILPISYIL